jgi:hypothetical protein
VPTVVDSKDRFLSAPEILLIAAEEFNNTEYPAYAVAAGLAEELTLPSADYVQIGNTVFIGHVMEERPDIMAGRALNADTAHNFVKSGLTYLAYLQNKKIKYYQTTFTPKSYLAAFQYWHNKTKNTDTEIAVTDGPDGYRGYITIGEQPLTQFWRP